MARKEAILVLDDGTYFEGVAIGVEGTAVGEVVFSTAMTGYQEMLTDPAFRGQILSPTYPLIGNYGVTEGDLESARVQVAGFVIRELCEQASNWRAQGELEEFLQRWEVVGIAGIDTRALTRRLRSRGVMMGTISTEETTEEALARLQTMPNYATLNFIDEVSTPTPYQWSQGGRQAAPQTELVFSEGPRIAVIDYGTKRNILRSLSNLGCEVVVLPYSFSAEEVLGFRPDGIVLSPGPGNPELMEKEVETVRGLIDKVPIMGVCLGQHLLVLAVGAKTYKLKFGHRGGNHPVKDLETGRVYITSQNHGFAAEPDSLKGTGLEVSQINLNDSTVEAVHHRSFPAMSLQYHPEACPGPLDNHNSFKKFVEAVKSTGGK